MTSAPPDLAHTLREGLALPHLIAGPLTQPRPGPIVGAGRPVLVIPGLTSGDGSTSLLRRTLNARGYRAQGWGLGLNLGANAAKLGTLEDLCRNLHARTGVKVVLIGWSMGGLYARVLAQRAPDVLAMVITLASPFSGDRRANRAWRFYNLVNDHTVDDPPMAEDPARKPDIPTIAIWSPIDGIISPECTRGRPDETDHTIEVHAAHFALGSAPQCIEEVIKAIAIGDQLA